MATILGLAALALGILAAWLLVGLLFAMFLCKMIEVSHRD
jgi:uncharacterized membrane protein AbrB (regulator of aidB expression)